MILSAGLSPAWQQTMVFERIRPGEVNRAQTVGWCAAGKVLNVGIAARLLGNRSAMLAPAGGDPLARMDRELTELGVEAHWIETQQATRICTTLVELYRVDEKEGADHIIPIRGEDRQRPVITELVEEARVIAPDELDRYVERFKTLAAEAEVVVISGSTPADVPVDFHARLLRETRCPTVLDIRGPSLLECLPLEPTVVKPNREELAATFAADTNRDNFGDILHDRNALIAAMRRLVERGAQWAVVTEGAGPVHIVGRDAVYRAEPPRLESIVNPIGSGDSMAAGIATGIRSGLSMTESIRLGIAAGIDNVSRRLPARINKDAVERIIQSVLIREIG